MKAKSTAAKMITGLAFAGITLLASAPASATCSDEPYIGSVCITAGTYCPRGYVEAQGQLMSIAEYSTLYAVIGTNYGGDGRTTFGVPDLRGRTPVGLGTGSGLTPVYAGAKRGYERQQLSVAQLASHNHPFSDTPTSIPATSNPGNQEGPSANNVLAAQARGGTQIYSTETANSSIKGPAIGGTTDPTGGSQSFSTVPPQQGLRYCMAVQGLFPPRN